MPIIMTSHTIIGKMHVELQPQIEEATAAGLIPHLAVVLVGEDPSSLSYISMKRREAERLNMEFSLHRLDSTTTESTILEVIEKLNIEPTITGIIVQLPLPESIDTDHILQSVTAVKDVDGLRKDSPYKPPTAQAIMRLLDEYDIETEDKSIVLVGKGRLVGGPLIEELKERKIPYAVCDESTDDLKACTLNADILISATGQTHLIKPSMIKDGAVVIDVDKEVVYEEVLEKVGYITPQKGGIGPLTVAYLLSNVVLATQKQLLLRHPQQENVSRS